MPELYEVEIRFSADADDPADAVSQMFDAVENGEPVGVFARIAHSGDDFEAVDGFDEPDDLEDGEYAVSVSFTFEARSAGRAAQEFLDNLADNRSWYADVTDNASGAQFNVNAENGEIEVITRGLAPSM